MNKTLAAAIVLLTLAVGKPAHAQTPLEFGAMFSCSGDCVWTPSFPIAFFYGPQTNGTDYYSNIFGLSQDTPTDQYKWLITTEYINPAGNPNIVSGSNTGNLTIDDLTDGSITSATLVDTVNGSFLGPEVTSGEPYFGPFLAESGTLTCAPAPEPASWLLFGTGLLGIALLMRKRLLACDASGS